MTSRNPHLALSALLLLPASLVMMSLSTPDPNAKEKELVSKALTTQLPFVFDGLYHIGKKGTRFDFTTGQVMEASRTPKGSIVFTFNLVGEEKAGGNDFWASWKGILQNGTIRQFRLQNFRGDLASIMSADNPFSKNPFYQTGPKPQPPSLKP